MLLISDVSLIVFIQFLQIFLWISIPAFMIGLGITLITHYRNKKKKQKAPEHSLVFENNGSFAGYDDASLIPFNMNSERDTKKFMNYLSFSNARYIAIQKDFKVLTEKYQLLQKNMNKNFETKNNDTMETIHTDLQQMSHQQIDSLNQQHEMEKKELLSELDQLTRSFENLEKDNNSLRDQLNVYCENGTGFTSMLQKWDEERSELKNRISEQEYLKDVLDEKKQQISFLQQQLEQRIKNHHLVEQQFRELGIKFMEANEKLEIKEQSAKEFQAQVHEKENEIIFLKEVLQSANDNVVQLEATIKELNEQDLKFVVESKEKNVLMNDLQAQLTESNEAKIKLEEKLERSQTFFKGFHRKLSDILQEENPESPVIMMKPVFKQESADGVTESAIQ